MVENKTVPSSRKSTKNHRLALHGTSTLAAA